MRAVLACFAVVSLVACGGKGGGGAVKPKGPVGPAIDAKEAEQGASDLITEIYETLGRGNKDSLFTLLDDSLIVFGPRRADMLGTRADALVALGQVVDPKAKKLLTIQSSKLEVIAAPGGRSALALDAATLNGQPHMVLAVLTNASDLWLVEAVAVAQTPTAQEVKAELAKDAVVPPGAAGTKKIDPSAQGAVEKFQRGLLDQAAWGAELGSRADAIVIGPTAGEVTRGKKDIKALWKKRVDARTRAAISGEITAAVTDDGQLAWVSAPITRVEGAGTEPLPLRAFAVYTNAGGDWKLLALHESLALGEPGSGAGFKKILPPMPVEAKPPEVIAARPKDKGEGKGEPARSRAGRKKLRKDKADGGDEAPKQKLARAAEEDEAPRKKKRRAFRRDADADGGEETSTKKLARAAEEDEAPRKKKSAKALEDEAPKQKKLAKLDEEDETPRRKKKRSLTRDDEEGEAPKQKKLAKLDEEDAAPKKSRSRSADSEEEAPKKKSRKVEAEEAEAPKKKSRSKVAEAEAEAESEAPKKKSRSKAAEAEAEAEAPKKRSRSKSAEAEAEAEAEAPKKKSRSKSAESESESEAEAPKKKSRSKVAEAEAEAEAEAPKKKSRSKAAEAEAEAEAEAPKKKKKKPAPADEDEIEIID